MKRIGFAIALALTLPLWVGRASAEPAPHTYRSTRVLAMGGAHMAIADDDATLFMNPAGLRGTRSFDLLNLELETNLDTIGSIQGALEKFGSSSNQTKQVADLIDETFGKSLGGGFRFFPNVIAGGFGIGILIDFSLPMQIVNPAIPEVRLAPTLQGGLALGYSMGFLQDEALRVGLVPKVMARGFGAANMKTNRLLGFAFATEADRKDLSPALSGDKGIPESAYPAIAGGVAATADLGSIYELHSANRNVRKLRPAFALVVRDIPIFDQSISQFEEQAKIDFVDETPKVPLSIGIGSAITPRLGPFRTKVGLDIEDVLFNTTDDTSLLKRTHLGAELQIPPFFKQRKKKEVPFLSLQAGLNQVYYTAGLNINIWRLLQIGVATYGEELGPVAGDKEDRRFLFRIAL